MGIKNKSALLVPLNYLTPEEVPGKVWHNEGLRFARTAAAHIWDVEMFWDRARYQSGPCLAPCPGVPSLSRSYEDFIILSEKLETIIPRPLCCLRLDY